MSLPIFFSEQVAGVNETLVLSEESSKHIVQVLRMGRGEQLQLTNGQGYLLTATIADDHKKKTAVIINSSAVLAKRSPQTTIAISLLKNSNRFEWFLEKATELGISEIVPLLCDRTERQHFRYDRMKGILISAMLQSQQSWLPELREPLDFRGFLPTTSHQNKMIAHCAPDGQKRELGQAMQSGSKLILIGPEGDFSEEEIALARAQNFVPVSLGDTRLRAETAGMVAAVMIR